MINITPKVNHIEKITGNVSFSNYQIIIAQKYERAVNRFNSLLSKKLLIEEKAPIYYFEFIINKDLKEEEYLILMDVSICHIQSGSEKGFYYACNTLENIFDLFSLKKCKKLSCKAYYIEDRPRFSFRSFMLDVSNNHILLEDIKKYIDLLSIVKINHLHLKFSNYKNFKINFKSIEGLLNESNEISYAYHEIKDLIKYANEKYVEIIPEIDVLGETYSKISLNENNYEYIINLFNEVCLLFKDSKYIHIGGNAFKDNDIKLVNRLVDYLSIKQKRKVIVSDKQLVEALDKKAIIQFYNDNDSLIDLINDSRKIIYSCYNQCIFDMPYAFSPLSKTYNKGISINMLSRKSFKNILGMEGCYFNKVKDKELLAFNCDVRVLALSEATWTNTVNHYFADFVERIEKIRKDKIINIPLKTVYLANGITYRNNIISRYNENEYYVEMKMTSS